MRNELLTIPAYGITSEECSAKLLLKLHDIVNSYSDVCAKISIEDIKLPQSNKQRFGVFESIALIEIQIEETAP